MDEYEFNVAKKLKKQELVDNHVNLIKLYDTLYNDNFKLRFKIEQQNSKISGLQKHIKKLESMINNYKYINILFD